jgi:hypothetical protein
MTMLPNWQKAFARHSTKWPLRGAELTLRYVVADLETEDRCRRPIHFGLTASVVCIAWLCWPTTTLAYRPFDGTDASVADLGEFETPLVPFGKGRKPR